MRLGSSKLTLLINAIASFERNLGYLTSSLTILSNTSSSSSPGNGDCNAINLKDKMTGKIKAKVLFKSLFISGYIYYW